MTELEKLKFDLQQKEQELEAMYRQYDRLKNSLTQQTKLTHYAHKLKNDCTDKPKNIGAEDGFTE